MREINLRLTLTLTILLLAGVGCVGKDLSGSPEIVRYHLNVPSAKVRIPLKINYQALPEGARAHMPAYDGDPFFVTLPVRQQNSTSAKQVFQNIVLPILNAIGFEHEESELLFPPSKGIKMPVANFKGLVQDLALEYRNNKESLRPKTQKILDTSLGKIEANLEINKALERGEGMNFSQLVAGIERQEIQFPFRQVVKNVPIEHTLILATRWDGQNVTSVRGVVFDKHTIANKKILRTSRSAVKAAIKALAKVKEVDKVISKTVKDGPHLVLLPYGSDPAGKTILRYAYRMILRTVFQNDERPYLLWLDAETGKILKLEPLFGNATAEGMQYLRDPGTGTSKGVFKVDSPAGGLFILKREGLSNRIDYKGDGNPLNDLSIPENTNGSSFYIANFDQAPFNDSANAICANGFNNGFQQIDLLASIHFYAKHAFNLGIFMPFPKLGGVSTDAPEPWSPKIEVAGFCGADFTMKFGACEGYFNPSCPNFSTGYLNSENVMNLAHDKTIVAHEVGHNITKRLTALRPSDYCGPGTCTIPVGLAGLHDLADVWADLFESTNCTGGWAFKNQRGVDNSLNCLNHHEYGSLPRLHEVSVPFDPAQPGDHFPEKPFRSFLGGGAYAHGQIVAAALWHTRLGMRSKSPPFGTIQYEIRFLQALKNTGFVGSTSSINYSSLYKTLYNLELEIVNQWAGSVLPSSPGASPAHIHNGSHTTNKVTAGFARTGLFLIPPQCLDGDPTTEEGWFCPVSEGGENGGDAVIDIVDNDTTDDETIHGVVHPEEDYLKIGGSEPTFHIWTGARYRLDGANGEGTFKNPAPCNSMFQVEVSTDEAFSPGSTIYSQWFDVDTDPTDPSKPECYGTWTPTPTEWNTLQANGALSLIYYRARTKNAAGTQERISTHPGELRQVPPPYAVLTVDGRSEY